MGGAHEGGRHRGFPGAVGYLSELHRLKRRAVAFCRNEVEKLQMSRRIGV